jgi:integrase/recombinase XerC
MTWHTAVHAFCVFLAVSGRPATTIALRSHQLTRLASDLSSLGALNPWQVTTDELIAVMASRHWAIETLRSHRAALVVFYRWAVDTGRITTSPAALLPRVAPGRHGARPVPEDVLNVAVRAADDRVRLMLLLAAREGLRRGEVSRIHSADLRRDLAGWSLLVHGKGNRDRVLPLGDDLANIIRARGVGWLFPGRIDGHLSPARVGELMSGVLPRGWTAHTLRHRFATRTYAGCRDLLTVQRFLGHSRPETTQLYVQLPDDSLRDALRFAA